jgi:hypothetical protein
MKKSILVFLFTLISILMYSQEALTIDELGNIQVENNLSVNGTIYGSIISDPDYESWAVGQYYSIPYSHRELWDFEVLNLESSWTSFDLSSIVPEGTKRVRIFVNIYGGGTSAALDTALLEARPNGSTADHWVDTGLVLIQTSYNGLVRIAVEVEVDLYQDRIIQFRETPGLAWAIDYFAFQIRGFYK